MKYKLAARILAFTIYFVSSSCLIAQGSVDSLSIVNIDVNLSNGHLKVFVIALDNNIPVNLSVSNLRFTEIDKSGNQKLLEIVSIDTTSTVGLYSVQLFDNLIPYKGEESILLAEWFLELKPGAPLSIVKDYSPFTFGSVFNHVPSLFKPSQWIVLFISGIGLLFVLFAIISLVMPVVKRISFRKKNVERHQRVGNVVVLDTVLNEPIQEGTLVVNVCRQLIPLTVWEGMGERCPHFPDCIHSLQCDGAGGKPVNSSYFSNTEDMKKWNWMMFGAIGGFIGWIIYAFCSSGLINPNFHVSIVKGILSALGQDVSYTVIANDTFYGICIGLGFTLSFTALERFQGLMDVSLHVSVFKILAGPIVGGISFFLGGLSCLILPQSLCGLLSWLIFGVLLGMVLSIKSSIPWKRGILAGSIASVLSYMVFFVGFIFQWESGQLVIEFFKLFSLLILGGIMGYTIITVVSSLEEFELEVLSPNERRGYSFPISKWIAQGVQVSIGKSPKAQVFIKWSDEDVLQNHADIYVKNDKVHIHAFGETLLNGRLLTTNVHTSLKNQDIIQLGRHSTSQLRFNEKRKRPTSLKPSPGSNSAKGKAHY